MPDQTFIQPSASKARRRAAFFCRLAGILLLVLVLLSHLPVTVPRLLGYQAYFVATGSMDPVVPAWCIAYVRSVDPSSLQEGDIIAYRGRSSVVVVHRVQMNNVPGEFLFTKGDNNPFMDRGRIDYDHVLGIYEGCFPGIGGFMYELYLPKGRAILAVLAWAGVFLIALSGFLSPRKNG